MRRPCLQLAVAAIALSACGQEDGSEAPVDHRPATPRAPAYNAGHQPQIELRRGIAGVRLGMRTDAVRQILGSPRAVRPSELHGGWTKWIYRRPRMRVTFDERGAVWDVRTYAREPRAPGGIGVGSTEQQLRRSLRDIECHAYGGPVRYRHWRVCADTRTYVGRFTNFTLIRGRVDHVTVARGLAV